MGATPVSLRDVLKAQKLTLAFAATVGVLMFTSAAKLLFVLFPAGCLLIAFTTIRKDAALFIEFVTWLFFLTPVIRRVVDYSTGLREMTIISTPFLVLSVPILLVLARWRRLARRDSSPFFYAVAAVLYGAFIACIHLQMSSAAIGLLTWATPILFGLYLLSEQNHAAALYRGMERALLGGTLVVGLYGLVQYFAIPAWDAAWMRSVDMVTIGKPEPMEVRVFSTMNSPQILAAFLMVGILVAYQSRGRWKYLVMPVGLAALVLSFARSAWIGLLAGIALYAWRASFKERFRLVTVVAGCALLVIMAMSVPELSETLSTRFTTFADLKHDESALDRQETYSQVIDMLEHSPTGIGLGVDNGMSDAENDSSIVAAALSLGLPGFLVFGVALGICVLSLLAARPGRDLPQLLGLQSCLAALMVESPLNNVINGQIAFLTWSLIGLSYGLVVTQRNDQQSVAVAW